MSENLFPSTDQVSEGKLFGIRRSLARPPLALRRLGFGDFGFLFGQQAQQLLPARLVGFPLQEPLVMNDVEVSHATVHGRVSAVSRRGH